MSTNRKSYRVAGYIVQKLSLNVLASSKGAAENFALREWADLWTGNAEVIAVIEIPGDSEVRTGPGDWRHPTHYETVPHDNCEDPAHCDCECERCMRVYVVAGEPGPKKGGNAVPEIDPPPFTESEDEDKDEEEEGPRHDHISGYCKVPNCKYVSGYCKVPNCRGVIYGGLGHCEMGHLQTDHLQKDEAKIEANAQDWRTIVAYLHWDGEQKNRLTPKQKYEVFCLGNGFGPDLTPTILAKINSGFDWSHIRDSSDGAKAKMAYRILKMVADNDPSTEI